MAQKLPVYLRTHRKRTGLSQAELAYLLGSESGTIVSRYERRMRQPSLEAAIACELVFNVPASTLFPEVYRKVEKSVIERALLLSERIECCPPNPRRTRKQAVVSMICKRKEQRRFSET